VFPHAAAAVTAGILIGLAARLGEDDTGWSARHRSSPQITAKLFSSVTRSRGP